MGGVVDALLGKSDKAVSALTDFQPVGIEAGGFNFGLRGGAIRGGSTQERLDLLTESSSLFKKQAGEVRSLRSRVAPGFSEFRQALKASGEARLSRIGASKTKAIGGLRENLARRRVLGSSFGSDALSRTAAEFGQAEDEILADIGIKEAQTTLQEIEATRALVQEEFNLARASIDVFINNLNLEASLATQLATNATSALAANAQAQAQILQQQANNTQGLLTSLLGFGTTLGAASLLGGGGAAAGAHGGIDISG